MKVLHILNHSLPKTDGYAIRSASIIRFQRELGIEPFVLTSPSHPGCTADAEIEAVRHLRTPPSSLADIPFVGQLHAVRLLAARIDEIVQRESPDILHAHSPCLWGEAAARIAKQRRLPLVYEIRGLWEDAAVDQGKTQQGSLRYRLSRALETRVARAANAVVTITNHLKQDLVDRGIDGSTIWVVPNGVDTCRFQPAAPDRHIEARLGLNGQIRVGYLGTLYPWEGVEDLVAAAPRILQENGSVRFIIVGGCEDDRLKKLACSLDVRDNVLFVGNVPHDHVPRYYSIMDMLVYPRKKTRNTEMVTPLKPLEAMAMEKPVVGSDVGGIRELLAPIHGLQFHAGDINSLAQTCLQCLRMDRQAVGKLSREYVVAHRNWATIAQEYVTIYNSVLSCKA